MKYLSYYYFFFAILLISCEPISERKQPPPSLQQLASSENLNLSGEQLADAYCGSCHLKPSPEILEKAIWENNILPDMRMRLGLYLPEDFGKTMPEDDDVPPGIYSKQPLIKSENWTKIKAYYLENAPIAQLPQAQKRIPKVGLKGFQLEIPAYDRVYPDLTTMVHIEEGSGDIWLGHRFRALFQLDASNGFKVVDSIPTGIAPISMRWNDDGFDLLTMGLMDPSNDSLGVLTKYSGQSGFEKPDTLISSLLRPVHMEFGDWNGDGVEDQAVSHFGDHLGKLSIYLSEEGFHREVILKALPGARKSIPVDFDQDGDLDLLGLMTQSNEGVFVWLNDGKGSFREKALLLFQPAFGSSDFSYQDMNQDGFKDIILVNGDNADLSQVDKNYHGVRVFLNNGTNEFEEGWFYPMNGASGLEIDDFDQDGDLDLFVISFFPSKSQVPKQNLIYFEQEEKMVFSPYVPALKSKMNWLTLAKGDIDLDGDQDIVVGAFEFNDLYKRPSDPWAPIIVFRNKLK